MTAPVRTVTAYELYPKQMAAMDAVWVAECDQVLFGGSAGPGKAISLSTPLPTPTGWTLMGDIRNGDALFDELGRVTRVTHVFDVIERPRSYRLRFDDGTSIEACAEHQWLTFDAKELNQLTRRTSEWRAARREHRVSRVTGNKSERFTASLTLRNRTVLRPLAQDAPTGTVRTTREIVETLRTHAGRANHAVPVAAPLDLPDASLLVDPYLLGVWLGDGSKSSGSITTMDAEIEAAFAASVFKPGVRGRKPNNRAWAFTARGLITSLRVLCVLGDKHVPQQYLRGSREQRLALLRGLMDTDGTVDHDGAVQFTNTNRRIVDAVQELVVSLGWKAFVTEGRAKFDGRDCGPVWDVSFSATDYVFSLTRKRERQRLATRRTTRFRYIVAADEIEPVPMRCISVDSPSHLYLAGQQMVPTHNSLWLRALAFHCASMWPGARIPVFRDNYTQLLKTQVAAFHREMAAIGFEVKEHWNATAAEWRIPNPYTSDTVIEFLHIDQAIGAEKWLSAEWACLLVDESTQISQEDHELLYTRVRVDTCKQCDNAESGWCGEHRDAPLGGRMPLKVLWRRLADQRGAAAAAAGITDPAEVRRIRSDWHPFAAYASNPGGKSHQYFKEKFVDPGRAAGGLPFEAHEEIMLDGRLVDTSLRRQFVPAYLTDNPSIDAQQYARGLAHLSQRRREQLLSGNWDFFEGKVFDMLEEQVHLVSARDVFGGVGSPPREWPRLAGLDHGTTSPTAAIPVTRDEDGFFIAGYWEYYAPGPNKEHIDGIRNLLAAEGYLDMLFEADPRMYHRKQGYDRLWSVADEFSSGGPPPKERYEAQAARAQGLRLHQSQAERIPARMVMQRLLEPDPDLLFPDWHQRAGEHGAPRMFICKQAPNLWRELNGLRFEADGEETVKVNDHAYDALMRAAVMFEQALYRTNTGQPRRIIEAAGSRR